MPNYYYGEGSNLTPPLPSMDYSNNYLNMPYSQEPQLRTFNGSNDYTSQLLNLYKNAGDLTSMKLLVNNPKSLKTSNSTITSGESGGTSSGKGSGFGKLGALSSTIGAIYDFIPTDDRTINSNDKTTLNIRSNANKTLMSGVLGPWGQLAGLTNTVIDKTGGFSDASQGLGKAKDFGNATASLALPGAGWFLPRTIDYKVSNVLSLNRGAWGRLFDLSTKAAKNSNAKLLFGRNKANDMISSAKANDVAVLNIMEDTNLALLGSNNPFLQLRNELQTNGNYLQNGVHYGKSGMKIDLDFISKVMNLYKKLTSKSKRMKEKPETFEEWYKEVPEDRNDTINYNLKRAFELAPWDELEDWRTATQKELDESDDKHLRTFYFNSDGVGEFMKGHNHPTEHMEIDAYYSPENEDFRKQYKLIDLGDRYQYEPIKKFKEGGSINVIPDGALHKNKHHMEDIDDKFEDVTAKGIPVVTEDDKGKLTQHAEVEREEIIFNLDVTNKLEKLMDDGSDNAAIEAGKLLVHEILENTVDNTGILNKIE